jgi:hypothetical protein
MFGAWPIGYAPDQREARLLRQRQASDNVDRPLTRIG